MPLPAPTVQDALDILAGSLWRDPDSAEFEPVSAPGPGHGDLIGRTASLVQIQRVALADGDGRSRLLGLLGAVASTGSSAALVARGDGGSVRLHLGATHPNHAIMGDGSRTLRAGLAAHYPGTVFSELDSAASGDLLSGREWDRYTAVAALTGIPSGKGLDPAALASGLDGLVDAMRGRRFALVVLADPMGDDVLDSCLRGYSELATALSPMVERRFSISTSESLQVSESEQRSLATSMAETVGTTITHTTSEGTARSGPSGVGVALGLALAATAVASVVLAPPTGGASLGVGAAVAGAAVGGMGVGLGLGGQKSKNEGKSDSKADQASTTETETGTYGRTIASALTKGITRSSDFTIRDRAASLTLDIVERHISRLLTGRRYGFWNLGVYVVSETVEDARVGAAVLRGMMRGEDSDLEPGRVLLWERERHERAFLVIRRALQHLTHPRMRSSSPTVVASGQAGLVSPTTLVTSEELGVVWGLPQRSIPGLPAVRHAEFGRAVNRVAGVSPQAGLVLGKVVHLSQEDSHSSVLLDVNSLTMHTLIVGTTGSGKTNAVLHLLAELFERGVSFLVIEPAKDEYQRLSGLGREGRTVGRLSIMGAHPLRFNPLAFPRSTHVLEHVDRMLEVFNAAFPLYGAMPALLEEALRACYESSGWDLTTSIGVGGPSAFPNLRDLVQHVEEAVRQARYSEEVTANYRAALVTRIRSLTLGIKGEVICPLPGEETSDAALFDECCVLNLEGLGSTDTRALVTGMLLVRLREYRVHVSRAPARSPSGNRLKHLTVLEEAHRLLKATSTDVAQDASNLAGMAVEAIASAIAEMRAYGQGFLIVDQSPAALDRSVVRNTNTKILFRSPHFEDRELVGRAIGASAVQIEEIARLPTGVAVTYQNDWLEPVLVRVPRSTVEPATPSPAAARPLTRWACLLCVALPVRLGPERAALVFVKLLQGGSLSFEEVPEEVGRLLGEPDVERHLRDLFTSQIAAGYRALRARWAAGRLVGHDAANVEVALRERLGLSDRAAKRVLAPVFLDAPNDAVISHLKPYFG